MDKIFWSDLGAHKLLCELLLLCHFVSATHQGNTIFLPSLSETVKLLQLLFLDFASPLCHPIFFTTQILGGHVVRSNWGLSLNDKEGKGESLDSRLSKLKLNRELAMYEFIPIDHLR